MEGREFRERAAKDHWPVGQANISYWEYAVEVQRMRLRRHQQHLSQLATTRYATERDAWFGHQHYMSMHIPAGLDGHYLLIAVRHLLAYAKYEEGRDPSGSVARARTQLDAVWEKPTLARDFLEHLDEYVMGRGRYRHLLPNPNANGGAGIEAVDPLDPESELMWCYGGFELPVFALCDAALELADAAKRVQFVRTGAGDVESWPRTPLPPF